MVLGLVFIAQGDGKPPRNALAEPLAGVLFGPGLKGSVFKPAELSFHRRPWLFYEDHYFILENIFQTRLLQWSFISHDVRFLFSIKILLWNYLTRWVFQMGTCHEAQFFGSICIYYLFVITPICTFTWRVGTFMIYFIKRMFKMPCCWLLINDKGKKVPL